MLSCRYYIYLNIFEVMLDLIILKLSCKKLSFDVDGFIFVGVFCFNPTSGRIKEKK